MVENEQVSPSKSALDFFGRIFYTDLSGAAQSDNSINGMPPENDRHGGQPPSSIAFADSLWATWDGANHSQQSPKTVSKNMCSYEGDSKPAPSKQLAYGPKSLCDAMMLKIGGRVFPEIELAKKETCGKSEKLREPARQPSRSEDFQAENHLKENAAVLVADADGKVHLVAVPKKVLALDASAAAKTTQIHSAPVSVPTSPHSRNPLRLGVHAEDNASETALAP